MLDNERILSFGEAARTLPKFSGRTVATSTIWRWATKGIGGVRLETRRIGRRYITSHEALDRFTLALAERPERPPIPIPKPPTTCQREKQIAQAEARLQAVGIL